MHVFNLGVTVLLKSKNLKSEKLICVYMLLYPLTMKDLSRIQVEGEGTVLAEEIETIKTAETHSFLLLPHNFLAITTRKFQETLYRCNLFDPNRSCYHHPAPTTPTPVAVKYRLLNFKKLQTFKNCPKVLVLNKTVSETLY